MHVKITSSALSKTKITKQFCPNAKSQQRAWVGGGGEGGGGRHIVTPEVWSHLQLAQRRVHHVFDDAAHHGAGR